MMRNILITGVTGTMGSAIAESLSDNQENNILGISRDEQKQRALPLKDNIKFR